MDDLKLGQLIRTEQLRDAIHIAVAPVVAGERLAPGAHVAIVDGKAFATIGANTIGVVDPFLSTQVAVDERCWLFLYPGSIESLRHEWFHPALDTEPVAQAKHWVMNLAAEMQQEGYIQQWNFDSLMQQANEFADNKGNWWGDESSRDAFTYAAAEFWPRWSILTGRPIPDRVEGAFYSCSC